MADMNNTAMKEVFAQYGKRVRSIRSAYHVIPLNQATSGIPAVSCDDIKFVTYGGVDFFIAPLWDAHYQRFQEVLIKTGEVASFLIVKDERQYFDPYLA